ncbi:hypothetical protein OSH11_20275 [Kaistia dalseonensis]|uniref:Uncharacterized protein n=1 Tax=Kaistia dalseonensis TaxID=410840 RepID=A0ABU0HDY3_9HYPH|nr:hypothetical protein [Kaistia dalseonensis]MCX5497053.1 hypothetical protein [Kaistia dalseonensis]MDQ0439679.1 hypothetical protein [Kaistia dalseonensis]
MDQPKETYGKQPPRKKAAVKRVTLSEEAKRAYEELVTKRDERDREYGRHLAADNKPR